MIPKIIHYCWFGGKPLSEETKKYINTWKKFCPDYEIKEWNESNFDVTQNRYCYEAYKAKKWAFVSDYARLNILYNYGGIYMDTDVEVCKSLNELLIYNAWSGFESDKQIPTGTMAAIRHNDWIKYLLSYYNDRRFLNDNGTFNMTTNVITITKMTKEKYNIILDGKKQIFGDNCLLLPFEYLCAKSLMDGKIRKTENTYTIHHFCGSWLTPGQKFKHNVKIILVKIFGEEIVVLLKKFI